MTTSEPMTDDTIQRFAEITPFDSLDPADNGHWVAYSDHVARVAAERADERARVFDRIRSMRLAATVLPKPGDVLSRSLQWCEVFVDHDGHRSIRHRAVDERSLASGGVPASPAPDTAGADEASLRRSIARDVLNRSIELGLDNRTIERLVGVVEFGPALSPEGEQT